MKSLKCKFGLAVILLTIAMMIPSFAQEEEDKFFSVDEAVEYIQSLKEHGIYNVLSKMGEVLCAKVFFISLDLSYFIDHITNK